ncbi:MAG: 6-bladed beta-propeller, partial [Nitrososphaeraceae archaeon]
QKFDSNGNFITKWGSTGTGDGQFQSPIGISEDPSGNIYVVDFGNDRVQKFDSNGNFITKWGSTGTGDGQFQSPVGIDVNSKGVIYVTDSGNSRVQLFSLTPK